MGESVIRRNSKAMQDRRARILSEARSLIRQGGIDALSLRTLAKASDVAVGTIYSLIGGREDVLIALFSDVQERFRENLRTRSLADPLEFVEMISVEGSSFFGEDEDYYRAAYLAIEHLDEGRPRLPTVADVFERGEKILTTGFEVCIQAGLLQGNIGADLLGRLAMQSYRTTWRDWACGHISLEDMRAQTLANAHIILMTDASPSLRTVLIDKLNLRQVV